MLIFSSKKFQSFQDRRIRVNPEDRVVVKKAKVDGNLHEVLLDRSVDSNSLIAPNNNALHGYSSVNN